MGTAKKLPSGRYRIRVYDYTDDTGKQHYKSFTADTKKQAEKLAVQYVNQERTQSRSELTFGACLDRYIEQRTPVLSPSTVREYKTSAKRYMNTLKDKKLYKITQEDVQTEINILSTFLSPKSVRNVHGLISAVFRTYRPEFALHTVLPKNVPPKIYVPSEEEIKRLMACVSGRVMELPILLAAFGPMRRGEICALRAENITGNIVHVCENMIQNENNDWVVKSPKSYAGDRYIEYPDFVASKWQDIMSGRLVQMNPMMVTHCFEHNLKQAGLPHFRFHDLRHYSASIQHALGVPDAYIMQRGGWANDGVLKQVYRHTMEEKTREINSKINGYFSENYDTKHDTK